MLSRAGALLRAHPTHRRLIARKQWETLGTRNYAERVLSGGKKRRDTARSVVDGDGINQAQDAPLTKTHIRRVGLDGDTEQRLPSHTSKSTWATQELKGTFASGTVTTSRPSGTTFNELLQKIRAKAGAGIPARKGKGIPTTVVLLFTPAFAQYALDQNVPNAVFDQLRIQRSFGMKYNVTSAVVDRLPTTPADIEGEEGMAYMYFANPPVANPGDQTPLQESTQKPGSLTFRIPQAWRRHKKSHWMEREIQLPLCQTIFSTGLVSTMFHREYVFQTEPGSSPALKLLGEKKLESQTVQFPVLPENLSRQVCHLPLVALTPFRRINYVMGNIVRKLSAQPQWGLKPSENGGSELVKLPEKEDMPASSELEEAVSAYFEALGLQPETVSVWALVLPSVDEKARGLNRSGAHQLLTANGEALAAAWHPGSPAAIEMSRQLNVVIRYLMPEGARLIKVLSGGGGWGKKAGLLSLDPDVQYSTRELRRDDGWQFNFDNFNDGTEAAAEAQKNQALGQIVKQGESIMFLLAPKQENLPESAASAQERLEQQESHPLQQNKTIQLGLSFGAIPSSIDFVPPSLDPDSSEPTITHYPSCFGMLSEGGMAMTTTDRKKGTSNQTKLDVPYGRYTFQQHDEHHLPNAWANLSTTRAVDDASSLNKLDELMDHDVAKSADSERSEKKGSRTKKNKKEFAERESEQATTSDLFKKFAEYDEVDSTSPPASGHDTESLQNEKPL